MVGTVTGPGSVGPVETRQVVLFTEDDPLVLESGAVLGPVTVAYETYGEPDRDGTNTVFICHALTGDAHAAGHHGDPSRPGWWDTLIGPGKPVDTDVLHVVSANLLGGCQGTTGRAAPIRPRGGRTASASRSSPSVISSRCTARCCATSASAAAWLRSGDRSAACRRCSGRSTTRATSTALSSSARRAG